VQWAVGLNGLIITVAIVLWLVRRDLERESRAQATRDYNMKREADYRAAARIAGIRESPRSRIWKTSTAYGRLRARG
jgi:hypothetical protein